MVSRCRTCKHALLHFVTRHSLVDPTGLMKIDRSLDDLIEVHGVIFPFSGATHLDNSTLPPDVLTSLREAMTCRAMSCHNAAGAMYRLVLDLATQGMLPIDKSDPTLPEEPLPNHRVRRNVADRIPWLIDHNKLPTDIAELADVVRHGGNDAAHHGLLEQADVDDLHDFTVELLRRVYENPSRLAGARDRMEARRAMRSNSKIRSQTERE